MAGKQNGKLKKWTFKGFENVELTREQIAALDETVDDRDGLFEDSMQVLVESGFKVSFSYDDYSGSIQGALTCKEPGSLYYGYVFTMRNVSPLRLIAAFRYLWDSFLKDELYSLKGQTSKYEW